MEAGRPNHGMMYVTKIIVMEAFLLVAGKAFTHPVKVVKYLQY
jgi:hypothetical protein